MQQTGSQLLQWHYMIFLLPLVLAAFFLLLSVVRPGRHSRHRHGAAPKQSAVSKSGAPPTLLPLLLRLLGVDKVPLPLFLELFCLLFGIAGFWANRFLLGEIPNPSFWQVLPSLGIALGVALLGSRLATGLVARLMPRDESTARSQSSLFGATGTIVFPTTETTGRIHIYDSYGTLHDESCRTAPGMPSLPKGSQAQVRDITPEGRLIVE